MRQNVAGKLSRPLRHRTDTAYDNDMRSLIWAVLAMATTACGGDGGTGTVDVSVWGEEYIEQGIPTSDFADGWTARFDRFLIVIGDVTLENTDGGEASVPGLTLYDLVTLGPHSVGTTDPLEATSWSRVGYRVAPATQATEVHASATEDDLALVVAEGHSVYVEGSVSNGTNEKSFRWGFSDGVRFGECVDVGGGQQTDGVVVTAGSTVPMQLTVHGDHFFYDDLQSSDAALRFDNLAAADADMDGEVTLEELAQVPLADLPAEAGPYGVGASDVNDLRGYLQAAVHTLGHFNGEGHCSVTVE